MKPEFIHIQVKGRVQGVFYRQSTLQKAQQLGLGGFVRNCQDGSVEALVIGTANELQALIDFCRQGPPHARVDDLISTPLDLEQASSRLSRHALDFSDFFDLGSGLHRSYFIVVK